jgi:uncharacterized membrane protein YphA (DoxX/SURF4 family)
MSDQIKKDFFGMVLGILFFLSGVPKIAGVQDAIDNFNRWGLGDNWRFVIGSIELIFGLLMFWPALKKYAAFGYFCIMIGGALVHIAAKEYTLLPMPVIFGLLTFYYLIRKDVIKFN